MREERASICQCLFTYANEQKRRRVRLLIPESAAACATMWVGNETRAWREGEVLYFDDSYEHEAG